MLIPCSLHRRIGRDLSTKIELSLVESLCGFHRSITTLDERIIVISSIPGEWQCVVLCVVLRGAVSVDALCCEW